MAVVWWGLDYWLAHAEGLTVEPLGARVERVVVAAPAGHAETLIVRSRVTRRRKSIPATSIAAVEPSTGHLLLEPKEKRERRPLPRPTARPVTGAARATGAGAVVVARSSRAGARASYAWSRPHALRLGTAAGRTLRTAAERTRAGAVWFAPRVRTAAVATARATYTGALLVARGGAVAACELERGLTHARQFDWHETARVTRDALTAAATGRPIARRDARVEVGDVRAEA